MRTFIRVAVACALGVLFSLAAQSVAVAHAELVGSTPTSGGSLAEPPTHIVLEFSDPVIASLSEVVVHDAGGGLHDVEDLSVVGEGRLVAVVDANGPEGAWRVDYRTVSVDGHSTEGTLGFTVSPEAPGVAEVDGGSSVRGWVIGVAALTVLATLAVVLAMSRSIRGRLV